MPNEDHEAAADREVQEVLARTPDEARQIDEIAKIRKYNMLKEGSKIYLSVQEYIDDKVDIDTTIKKITGPLDEKVVQSPSWEEEVEWLDMWDSILHSARRIPFRNNEGHMKLVDLVKAYKEHPEPAHEGEQGLYEQLLYLGIASRESLDNSPGCGAGYAKPEIHAYANLHYFFALLTKEGVREYWIYCIWAMRDALEDNLEDDRQARHKPGSAAQKYDAFVPAAAMWVLVLEKALYEREEDRTPTNRNQGNPARGGQYWKGKPEFSKARWALWKNRFSKVSGMTELSDETRQIAKEAVECMEESQKA